MKIFRKAMVLTLLLSIISVMNLSTAYADEVGSVIGINQDNAEFTELFRMENGKTYLPIRLAFPNLNDTENKIGMTISWGVSYPVIHLIYGSTTGGPLLDGAAPYEGVRKCVDIFWEGDITQGVKADLSVIDYTYDENGQMKVLSTDDDKKLNDLIYLKSVNNESHRIFMSLDDINKIAKLLGIQDVYSVKLYK